jgi:hypothetical protein
VHATTSTSRSYHSFSVDCCGLVDDLFLGEDQEERAFRLAAAARFAGRAHQHLYGAGAHQLRFGSSDSIRVGVTEILGSFDQGAPSGAGRQPLWRALPASSVARLTSNVCVLGDGRFAVFGGLDANTWNKPTLSCEVLTFDGDGARWDPLLPLPVAQSGGVCAAIGGCVVIVGGDAWNTVVVYEEGLGQSVEAASLQSSSRRQADRHGQRCSEIECLRLNMLNASPTHQSSPQSRVYWG